jgi:hypothetical protein
VFIASGIFSSASITSWGAICGWPSLSTA